MKNNRERLGYFLTILIFLSFFVPEFLNDFYREGFQLSWVIKSSIKITGFLIFILLIFPRSWIKVIVAFLVSLNIFNITWTIEFKRCLSLLHLNIAFGATRDDLTALLEPTSIIVLASCFLSTGLMVYFAKWHFIFKVFKKYKRPAIIISSSLILIVILTTRITVAHLISIHPIFPLIYSSYDQFHFKQLLNERTILLNPIQLNDSIERPEIQVLVLGETLRSDHLQINGYQRNTTPRLGNQTGIINSKNSISGSGYTRLSIPMILTDTAPEDYEFYFKNPSIINVFKKANYQTFWISNQSNSYAEFDLLLTESDSLIRLGVFEQSYDIEILKVLEQVIQLNELNKLIVIHLHGNHHPYHLKYPIQEKKFIPDDHTSWSINQAKELINAYDNSIVYTDYILSEIIKQVKNTNKIASVVFTSDHGESLFENNDPQNRGHGFNANPPNFMVPLVFWSSDQYRETFQEIVATLENNSTQPTHVDHLFHTILHMNQINYEGLDKTKSLASPEFEPYNKRPIVTGYKKIEYFEDLPKVRPFDPNL